MTTGTGGIEVLKVQEKPDPKPRAGEIAIRVRAAGLNFADILSRQGLYPDSPPKPCVMGYEVSGVIEEVGEGINPSFVGKSVAAMTRFGGQSDLVVVKATQVFDKPADLTFEQAAAIPVNYLTAYALLVVMGSLHAGESLLIHNAGGGVGLAALDIAKKIGAVTYGTASPSKHKFLAERGLDHAIDYRGQDWQPVLKELTKGRGVDLIIDPIGGSHWKKSFASLRHTGRLGMFGVSTASANGFTGKLKMLKAVIQTPWFHALPLLNRNRGVFGLNLGHMWHEPEKVAIWMRDILRGVEEGWVQPYVDQAFSFDEAGKAHQYLEARKNIGKVVLVP
ncbi:MAG: medium chain dehydrogenase/reductase family protein [Acidobacteria bacterium]|nr:medium chain dehydrogenase/reductase family protein [Acidobacteriota bacterium]MCA1627136.1 medium chain dehydrogenase/reductase family protein [Acidobacteriota bacterium]